MRRTPVIGYGSRALRMTHYPLRLLAHDALRSSSLRPHPSRHRWHSRTAGARMPGQSPIGRWRGGSAQQVQEDLPMRKLFSLAAAAAFTCVLCPVASAADAALDYEYFKARVEPIFLTKRDNHVRCYVCHSESNSAFKL